MSFLFTCPHCQTRTEVDDEYSGRSGNCVVCGQKIELPRFATSGGTPVASRKGRGRPVGWIAAAVVVLLLVGATIVSVVQWGTSTASAIRQGRIRVNSIRNVETIAAALNAYASDHGSYPPPYTTRDDGTILHSWRVLVLPYLDAEDIYNQFDLDEPWDSPANQSVAMRKIPAAYRNPDGQGWINETVYTLVTGPGTLFPKTGSLGPSQIGDGNDKTILVAEAKLKSNTVLWTEPLDLDVSKFNGSINVTPGVDLGGVTSDGVCVATADGRGHFIPDTTPPMTVQSLLTPNGNEPLADDVLD